MAETTAQFPVAQPGRPPWLPWPVFPFTSRFAAIDGKPIHYIDEGSGPALLFVSAGQWAFMFRDVIVRLRRQFRCLTLDFPGCGLSPDPRGHDHSVPANAQILAGFIDALDLRDITMVVHDVGGPLGFLVATRRPDRFRGLVISQPRRPAGAHPVRAQERSLRLARPVRADLPPGGGRRDSRRAPLPVQRRPRCLQRRDLRLVGRESDSGPLTGPRSRRGINYSHERT